MKIGPDEMLGPYRVLEKLGEGGMGAVYRAHDPRLDRVVAIKVLPDEAAADAGRRERFLLEARAIAALTHPNIVTIYSVEEDAGRIFLTLEYVEGRPLSDAIPTGGMTLDRLLGLAIPMADAVAAAHEKGIVHRDLKPSNVMLSRDGRVKVLDFGLAKLRDAAAAHEASLTRAPAIITRDGVILGTIAYMAPEQAEGRPIDHRTDIFALGVMLYEMATGRRPFVAETTAALVAAILRDMPPPVTDLNADLPAEFARVVRRCLAKDPTRRYQTALDVRNELEDLQRDIESNQAATSRARGTLDSSTSGVMTASSSSPGRAAASDSGIPAPAMSAASATAVTRAGQRARRWIVRAGIAAGSLALAIGAFVLSRSPGPAPAAPPPVFVERQVTSNPAEDPVWYASISPDGRYLAYGDFTGIHLRLADTGETRTVPVPEGICFT